MFACTYFVYTEKFWKVGWGCNLVVEYASMCKALDSIPSTVHIHTVK